MTATDIQNVVPHTEAEFVAHLRVGVKGCPVCGIAKVFGAWTDFNGQVRCNDCGCTIQIIGGKLKEDWLSKHGMTPADVANEYCDCFEYVPLLKAYYESTGNKVPWGTYLGDPKWMPELRQKFYQWLSENADSLRPAWEEFFRWDDMLKEYK